MDSYSCFWQLFDFLNRTNGLPLKTLGYNGSNYVAKWKVGGIKIVLAIGHQFFLRAATEICKKLNSLLFGQNTQKRKDIEMGHKRWKRPVYKGGTNDLFGENWLRCSFDLVLVTVSRWSLWEIYFFVTPQKSFFLQNEGQLRPLLTWRLTPPFAIHILNRVDMRIHKVASKKYHTNKKNE